MIRKLAFAAALAPAPALAHSEGHEEMSLAAELAHMLSDPLHLVLVAGAVGAVALIWVVVQMTAPKRKRIPVLPPQ